MTDEEINIAIAEACGWWGNCKENCMRPPNCTDMYCKIPNYCHDLNAMHEAEKVITDTQWAIWANQLYIVLFGENLPRTHRLTFKHVAKATARQRAEALLKTLNLWKA